MRRNVNGWVWGLGVLLLPGMAAAQQEPEPPPGVTAASAYVGLSISCAVFSGQWWNAGDVRGTQVRGVCGVPQDAVAVQLEVRSESLGGQSPQVKVWAADAPEPTQGVLEEEFGKAGQARQALALVSLCGDGECAEGDLLLRSSAQALLEVRVAGYFQPWAAVSGESAEDTTGVSGGGTLTATSDELLVEPLAGISGPSNNFFGEGAGFFNTGISNSFFGGFAGSQNTDGSFNSFFGQSAGLSNTGGIENAFFGSDAGRNNTIGSRNAFFGDLAGFSNDEGIDNSFFGSSAGLNNTMGSKNAFFGRSAGALNSTGINNAFFGHEAGVSNNLGNRNTFVGISSGAFNTTGSDNAFFGRAAGFSNKVENFNTFIGAASNGVADITNATALGYRAKVSQSNSLVLGSIAGENNATESVNVGIGVAAPVRQLHIKGPNAVLRLDRSVDATTFQLVRTSLDGNTVWKTFSVGTRASGPNQGEFVIQDFGQNTGGASQRRMTIANNGNVTFPGAVVSAQSFSSTSSLRYKNDVQTLSGVPEALASLRGVRFAWKETGEADIGLIAEEVADVFPELVQRDAETGAVESVNYPALVAVLIEGFKTQQGQLQAQTQLLAAQVQHAARQDEAIAGYQGRLAAIERQHDELAQLKAQLTEITDRLLSDTRPVLAQR